MVMRPVLSGSISTIDPKLMRARMRARGGVGGGHRGQRGALLGDPGHGQAVDAALLALLDHHAAGHLVAEPDGQGEPALLVEAQLIAADEHRITPCIGPPMGSASDPTTVPASPPGDTVTH